MLFYDFIDRIMEANLNVSISVDEVLDYKVECSVVITITKAQLNQILDLNLTDQDFKNFEEEFNADKFLDNLFDNEDFSNEYYSLDEINNKEILDNVFYGENIIENIDSITIKTKLDIEYE